MQGDNESNSCVPQNKQSNKIKHGRFCIMMSLITEDGDTDSENHCGYPKSGAKVSTHGNTISISENPKCVQRCDS